MKRHFVALLIGIILIGCVEQSRESKYDQQYRDIVKEMAFQLNRLGHWEYSPDGKDSVWTKSDNTCNLNLLDSVFNELLPIERKWDSVIFLGRKYDSIPPPADATFNNRIRIAERKTDIVKNRLLCEELIEGGVYDRNGKQLRDLAKEAMQLINQ